RLAGRGARPAATLKRAAHVRPGMNAGATQESPVNGAGRPGLQPHEWGFAFSPRHSCRGFRFARCCAAQGGIQSALMEATPSLRDAVARAVDRGRLLDTATRLIAVPSRTGEAGAASA